MGFLSLNFSSAPTIYGFGNIIAIVVCWAFVFTIMLLPTMILLMPVHRVPKPLGVGAFISAMTRLVETRERTLFWGSLGLILFTLCLLPLNKLDSDRFAFIDKDSDARIVLTALREKIGHDQALVYGIRSSGYYGITDPAFLVTRAMEDFVTWVSGSKIRRTIDKYNNQLDDYELMQE